MTLSFPANSWFIGCGNMGGAMIAGWRKAGVDLSGLSIFSPSGRTVDGVRVTSDWPTHPMAHCWLGHKPYQVDEVAERLGDTVTDETVVISILGGVECASLRRLFPRARAIVRAMPNLPVSEGEGVTGLYSDDIADVLRADIDGLVSALGLALWGKKEADLTAISTVAGSGPSYVARFATALATEAERLGLAPGIAMKAALQTLGGTGNMALASGEAMDSLASRVASPGGSTQAGLDVLDGANGIADLVHRTIEAARRRTEQMAAEARG
ncbi:pyrroline-5-carboxylate reductase dimerization domain-containing protein [Sphingomicrobium sp. XHP0235]|uniref:pyrroline-5-carboxylate reductase family protein n=1 Tax=Sphingomicrobium aquimarinum TaxID=3133971 RepID=UPI0031FEA791